MNDFLYIQPHDLKFPVELRKQSSCSMQLTNKTNNCIAFKVKTTNPRKYSVRPNTGVVLPGATCDVIVTMQAQKEAPADMQCKDKFLVQSTVAPDGATTKDLNPEMFNRMEGRVVEDFKLRVVYIPANPPSPVPEESEEGSPPRENGNEDAMLSSAVTNSLETANSRSSEAKSLISKLIDEKASFIQQNQKLCQELDMLRREVNRRSSGRRVSILHVVLIAILSVIIGYFLK